MPKFVIYFSVILSLIASNAFANNSETIKMNQPHTLTLNDVEFNKKSGRIEGYTADYKDIVIPDNFDGIPVTEIGDWAFAKNALTSVTIPNTVIFIGEYAFYDNKVTLLSVPNSVSHIGYAAFLNYNNYRWFYSDGKKVTESKIKKIKKKCRFIESITRLANVKKNRFNDAYNEFKRSSKCISEQKVELR